MELDLGVVEELLGVSRVGKWRFFDGDGFVYGHPSMVDIDLVVRDGEHVLVEVKASVSRGDVLELHRIGQLYEKATGVRPRLAIISPYADERARETASQLGVELYTAP